MIFLGGLLLIFQERKSNSQFIFFFLSFFFISLSYVVCSGVVDDIRSFFSTIHGPLNEDLPAVNYAQACLALLSATAQYLGSR